MMQMKDLEEHIQRHAGILRELHERNGTMKLPKYVSIEEFVGANGYSMGECCELPDHIERGEKKQCFTNSAFAFMRGGGELVYCEGIAAGKELAFPVHHAWLIDEDGDIFDPTWEYGPGEALYFGIPFDEAYVFETMRREGYYGMLAPSGFFNKVLFEGTDLPDRFVHPWFAGDLLPIITERQANK